VTAAIFLRETSVQQFVVSIVAGLLFPLLPVLGEWLVKSHVTPDGIAVTGSVYAAAVGLASRYPAVVFSSMFFAVICAMIYVGLALCGMSTVCLIPPLNHAPFLIYGFMASIAIIIGFSGLYILERYVRHCIERESFLDLEG
jgi:hypothetical protein